MSDNLEAQKTLQVATAPKVSQTLEQLVSEKAPSALNAIPEKTRMELRSVTIERSIRIGPLPPPEELAAYNQIIPDGANRMMTMVERQSAHRIEIEKQVIESQQQQGSRGQIFGLIIAILFGTGALYAAMNDKTTFACVFGGSTLLSLVGVFVYSQSKQKVDLKEKREQMIALNRPPATNNKKRRR
jgi:uncharacterized membrane protein